MNHTLNSNFYITRSSLTVKRTKSDLLKCTLASTFSQMNPVIRDTSWRTQYYKCSKNVPNPAWQDWGDHQMTALFSPHKDRERGLSSHLFSLQCCGRRDDTWAINWEKLHYVAIYKQTGRMKIWGQATLKEALHFVLTSPGRIFHPWNRAK